MQPQYTSLAERLIAGSDRSGEHWLWTDTPLGKRRYIYIRWQGQLNSVHRFALADALGYDIPDGLQANHVCDMPLCIRNDEVGTYESHGEIFPRYGHLWMGSQADNLRDMFWKKRNPNNGLRLHPLSSHGRVLEPEDIPEIIKLYADGHHQREIANLYGVKQYAIFSVLHGVTWGRISGIVRQPDEHGKRNKR